MSAPFRLTEFVPASNARLEHPRWKLSPARPRGNEFTVIIGPNGTGKSALLGGLARAAENGVGFGDANPSRTIAIANLVTDAFPLRRTKEDASYQYLGLRQGSNTVSTGALTAASMVALLTLPMSPVSELDWRELCGRLQMEPPFLTATPLKQSKDSGMEARRRFAEIDARISVEFERGELLPRLSEDEWQGAFVVDVGEVAARISGVMMDFGEVVDAASVLRRIPYAVGWRLQLEYERKPSAGQEVLFSQLLRYASGARAQALVLVDEPETALHPQWQSNVIALMREVVPDSLGMHVLLATHSPFLIGDADSVLAASRAGLEQLHFDFGATSIDEILYRIFGATTSGSILVEQDVSNILHYLSDATSSTPPSISVVASAERLRGHESTDTEMLREILADFDRTVRGREGDYA